MKKVIASGLLILGLLPLVAQNEAAVAAYNQGISEYNNKDFRSAVQSFDKAILADSTFGKAWFNRAVCKTDLKDYTGAVSDYSRSIAIGGENNKAIEEQNALLKEIANRPVRVDVGNFFNDSARSAVRIQ